MRKMGASDGWFVVTATSSFATVTSPAYGATVLAGSVTSLRCRS